jgi:hypothetical protein
MDFFESVDADEELVHPAGDEVVQVAPVGEAPAVRLDLDLPEPVEGRGEADVSVQLVEGRHFRTGEDQVLEALFPDDVPDDVPVSIKADGRQRPPDVRQHADAAGIVAAEPDGDDDVLRQVDASDRNLALHDLLRPPCRNAGPARRFPRLFSQGPPGPRRELPFTP